MVLLSCLVLTNAFFAMSEIAVSMVIDEYGGVSGLVTMEDLLEVIVGDIKDEYDGDTAA